MTAVTTRSLILCVDDYEDILDGWRVLLENEGYRVMTAADANRAIELMISQPIDEVILDYQLPEVTGDLWHAR
jgi:CheY-like chemotaxis protein